ncbi:large conductance mechanosensitive channel protein MscL [Leptolyngbya sp. FACHB-541]|uniref:large conductance mechanosensitive channel protein MscL n=1 Tax=Leptolyngbya sp. FACHB-541 TaxID=2692810 RepID=UPI0016868819|nr:large conductance mechanosensitive channel protein MscL [Leptolyngbya sp. FACHB-541]MBD1996563.1 large conductance mechanosensitive channel protein MscL [Leptolyngbya sp. FACHB-541]
MAIRRGRSAAGGFLRDFREFALKGNVMDLAIAVIIGGAFGKIVTSFVQDLVMPIVSLFIPGGNWRTARIVLVPGTPEVEGSEKAILIGSFLGSVVDFVIIAFVIYLVIRALARFKRQEEVAEAETAPVDPIVVSQERLTTALDRLTQTLDSRS